MRPKGFTLEALEVHCICKWYLARGGISCYTFMLNKCSEMLEWAVFNGAVQLVSMAVLASFVSIAVDSSLAVNFPRSGVNSSAVTPRPVWGTSGESGDSRSGVLAVNFLFSGFFPRVFTVWIVWIAPCCLLLLPPSHRCSAGATVSGSPEV